MSRAAACVRFPDGVIKWCLYNGTSDMLVPRLFDDSRMPWDVYYERNGVHLDPYPEPEGEVEPVTIYSDYGRGFWWEGTAARNVVTSTSEPPDEAFADDHAGAPDWVRWSVAPPTSREEEG